MALQTRDLVMVALGVLDDQKPPNPEQPPLADGIHLRWSFARKKGFPWFGYYLFRRAHLVGNPVCLTSVTKELQKGPWPRKSMGTHLGQVSSDANLVLTRAFNSSPSVEFDLNGKQNGRSYVRFDFPKGQPARFVEATIGFRPGTDEILIAKKCVSFGASSGVGPNPRNEPVAGFDQPMTFSVSDTFGTLAAKTRIESVDFDGEALSALNCGTALEITLPCASSVVDLVISQTSFPATITALNQDGSTAMSLSPQVIPQGRVPVTLAGTAINRILIQTTEGETRLHDICFVCAPITGGPATDITVTFLSMGVPVSRSVLTGNGGDTRTASFEFDLITAVEFSQGPAVLIDICFVPVAQDATRDWETISVSTTPICLPVAVSQSDYPCKSAPKDGQPDTAKNLALDRVKYGSKRDWPDESLTQMHETLKSLVAGGPTSTPMAARFDEDVPAEPDPDDPDAERPKMKAESQLDTVLLGALNPAFAQMIGLYWVDGTAVDGVAYDYLIVADYEGSFSPVTHDTVLRVSIKDFDSVDGYIVFNVRKEQAPPLPAPGAVRGYSLPGAGSLSGPRALKDATNNAGLLWDLGLTEGTLLTSAPFMYHIWRADIGIPEPASPPVRYHLLTGDDPVVVSADLPPEFDEDLLIPSFTDPPIRFEFGGPGITGPERSKDWPPFRLQFIDSALPDGWYSYQVCSLDIFGRYSPRSLAAAWFQWQPVPNPQPWYYQLPAADKPIHDFAVHLLDKNPPPPPTAIEAYAVDPADPTVVKDDAYNRWRQALTVSTWYQALTQAQKNDLIGLRVRWQWTEDHRRQAPDTREFRIYYHPDRMNALIGTSLSVSAAAGSDSSIKSVVSTDIANGQPANAYMGLWIQVGDDAFPIDSSEAGSPLRLTVINRGKDKNVSPRADQACTIAIKIGHPRFVDYSESANWSERLHKVAYDDHVFTPERDVSGNEMRGNAAAITLFVVGTSTLISLDRSSDLSNVKRTVENQVDILYLFLANDTASSDKLYRIISVEEAGKIVTVAGIARLSSEPSSWIIGQRVHKYEVFLPDPGGPVHKGLPMVTTLDDPIKYAHIGVSSADDKDTADKPKWASSSWGSRTGNEGRVGAPAKIFRVRREKPLQPRVSAVSPDSDRVFASRADYFGHSFYTYRWQPSQALKTHILRALDDTIFNVDWGRPPRTLDPKNPEDLKLFPRPPAEPRWDSNKVELIVSELNAFDALKRAGISKKEAIEHYNSLSNDALRVLAGLSGNETAFSQLTTLPLDPDDPLSANRIGPDNPDSFVVDGSLRAYVDTLDGRSTNRYFYRSADLDSAHNISSLSLSSLPVYLPDVVPPRAPVLTKALGGDKQITLKWASNREADLKEYHVYRADSEEETRDLRLMNRKMPAIAETRRPEDRSAEVIWTDSPIPSLVISYYRVAAVDEAGNQSEASNSVAARAYDQTPPEPPNWMSAVWNVIGNAIDLRWSLSSPDLQTIVLRRSSNAWQPVSPWLSAGLAVFIDSSAKRNVENRYRLRVRNAAGNVNIAYLEITVAPL